MYIHIHYTYTCIYIYIIHMVAVSSVVVHGNDLTISEYFSLFTKLVPLHCTISSSYHELKKRETVD